MKIDVKVLSPHAILPTYGSENAAGADLYACLEESVTVQSGETVLIPTGLAMAIPAGYGGFLYARSGLSVKLGLAPANKVGVIDADYRGEIKIALYNQSSQARSVAPGDRVAQLVIAPVFRGEFTACDALPETERGAGGFGSTGK